LDIVLENNIQTKIKHIDVQDCTRSLLAMELWINEGTEIDLSDQLNIESGDIHRMAETANWLAYSLRELSRLLGRIDLIKELDDLRQRIIYGIKEELIDLVKIKGIGRVRARRLYRNNIKTRQDLAATSVNQLAAIDKIGMTVANNIKSQLKVR
jgi:helicase